MKVNDDVEKKLHDRLTRGKKLSREEQALLNDWYKDQDREEMETLNRFTIRDLDIEAVQKEINTVLTQIRTTIEHIQEITKENSVLRQEIAAIQHQLIQKTIAQPA